MLVPVRRCLLPGDTLTDAAVTASVCCMEMQVSGVVGAGPLELLLVEAGAGL